MNRVPCWLGCSHFKRNGRARLKHSAGDRGVTVESDAQNLAFRLQQVIPCEADLLCLISIIWGLVSDFDEVFFYYVHP